MLQLKHQEAIARSEEFEIESVTADVGTTTKSLTEHEHRHISARPEDVEDYAAVFVTDEIIRGYSWELRDFLEAVAYDREALSGFNVAYETVQVIYAAYMSSYEGRRVTLNP